MCTPRAGQGSNAYDRYAVGAPSPSTGLRPPTLDWRQASPVRRWVRLRAPAVALAGGAWLHGLMITALRASAVVFAAGLACGSGRRGPSTVTIAPPPEPVTRATLVGPLCEADVCRCRAEGPADGGAGEPEAGVKRFEIKVGPSEHELWVTLDDMVLYKSSARAEDCFYVDLGAGNHTLGLRASRQGGLSARVHVSEYAPATRSWYQTFRFTCGSPGLCAHAELDEQKAEYARYQRGIHDPCGSVKIRGLSWDSGVAPDQLHPDDLQLGLTLEVRSFAPEKPHGDPACANNYE